MRTERTHRPPTPARKGRRLDERRLGAYLAQVPCAGGCLALFFPRIALVLVWLFGPPGYLSAPFPHVAWPILGFLFLPTTTLAYVYGMMSLAPQGAMSELGWVLVIVGVVIDLGLHGGGGRAAVQERRRRRPAKSTAWED
ncbi:MAG: hypothetical protein ACFCGT_07540 [Sandaracinaceae bacterium]